MTEEKLEREKSLEAKIYNRTKMLNAIGINIVYWGMDTPDKKLILTDEEETKINEIIKESLEQLKKEFEEL